MADEYMRDADPPKQDPPKVRPDNGMKIVGFNLLALLIYTIALKFVDGGFIFDAFLIAVHVFACGIMALAKRSWMWALSGVLVLAIGFSTCVWIGEHSQFN